MQANGGLGSESIVCSSCHLDDVRLMINDQLPAEKKERRTHISQILHLAGKPLNTALH